MGKTTIDERSYEEPVIEYVTYLDLLTEETVNKFNRYEIQYKTSQKPINPNHVNIPEEHAHQIPKNPRFIRVQYGFLEYALYATPDVLKNITSIPDSAVAAIFEVYFAPRRPFRASLHGIRLV